ncbi:hypothetical protein QTN25_006989 [Entamoeba marina]
MTNAAASKNRALYDKYKAEPLYDKMIPKESELTAKYFGVANALGQEGREMLYNKQLMDPRAAKAFAERRGFYYDDQRDIDGDGVKDIIAAERVGDEYIPMLYNGHYVTKQGKSQLPLKLGYYSNNDRDMRKDKTWTDVYLAHQGKEGTPKYRFDKAMKDILKQAINGSTLTLADARKLLWSIVLEACFENAEPNRPNLNRLLAKKAGKAVMNSILENINANLKTLTQPIYAVIKMHANIVSRGGEPDNFRQYLALEQQLKQMIIGDRGQVAFVDWFPLSQKRSEKDTAKDNQIAQLQQQLAMYQQPQLRQPSINLNE